MQSLQVAIFFPRLHCPVLNKSILWRRLARFTVILEACRCQGASWVPAIWLASGTSRDTYGATAPNIAHNCRLPTSRRTVPRCRRLWHRCLLGEPLNERVDTHSLLIVSPQEWRKTGQLNAGFLSQYVYMCLHEKNISEPPVDASIWESSGRIRELGIERRFPRWNLCLILASLVYAARH